MTEARHTLYELNQLVRETLETEMPDEYWVEAELSECRESRGHCYLELIQKEELTNTPIARASAKCWANSWTVIHPYFERTAGQALHAGMKVLLKVYPQFHEAFGFSWIVTDIDPTYTIGDSARRRQEIIRQLKEEGVFDLQRELSLPLFAQRIAVITSETAAGYGDFLNQLQQNEYGFCFEVTLFPAIMQGEQVEQSVINALNQIHAEMSDNNDVFDVVVMIRGGGATSDMSGFDTLALAENVANFPIPIITGIGHERDECILDMISHTRMKTPTAAAAFLISQRYTEQDGTTGEGTTHHSSAPIGCPLGTYPLSVLGREGPSRGSPRPTLRPTADTVADNTRSTDSPSGVACPTDSLARPHTPAPSRIQYHPPSRKGSQ